MLGPPPTEWTRTTWFFVILGTFYVVGVLVYWFRFQAAERAAKSGAAGAPERFNAMLAGFPNAIYAKMLGKKPFAVTKEDLANMATEEGAPPRGGAG